MSSIRLLHRSSLSLLPLQCCNCNNFIAYILLLITSLLRYTLCGIYNNVSKKNNSKSSPCLHHLHQNQQKDSYSHPLVLKSPYPYQTYSCSSCFTQYKTESGVSIGRTEVAGKLSANTDCQTSDTYILTPLTTAEHCACNNCSCSSISNCAPPPITWNRRSQVYSKQKEQQALYQTIGFRCVSKSKNTYRSSIRSSVNGQDIYSDCSSPNNALFIRTNTTTNQLSSKTTSATFAEAVVAATVSVPTLVDLTHSSLHPTLTPYNNRKDSPITSKHLFNSNNTSKPFSNPSVQRLNSSSSTPLLQENQQSTHSNADFGVSTSLHVLVQQRKSSHNKENRSIICLLVSKLTLN